MGGDTARGLAAKMAHAIGARKVHTAPEILTCYAFDATNLRRLPLAVVLAESLEDVEKAVGLSTSAGVPVIPRGAGTGFAGGTIPVAGGVVISTERMNRVISIDAECRLAWVEAGVVNSALQAEAGKAGLMFPPDPSSLDVCTLGGNVAQDAGGPRALKYGVTRDYVCGLEAVLWNGKVIECGDGRWGSRCWDPVGTLLVGSEGTLGFITRICLRLVSKPQGFATALVFFPTTVAAADAVSQILAGGVVPAALELIDAETLGAISRFVEVEIPRGAGCSLLIEADGARDEAREVMHCVEDLLRRCRATEVRVAATEQERQDLWRMRRSVSPSLARIAPWKINEDVCVPRSRLPVLADAVGNLSKKYGLRCPTFGHAGDGNLHVNVMLDRRNADEVRRSEALVAELFETTIRLEGTISGEHGIGLAKLPFLPSQLGSEGVAVQRAIKKAFDPECLVNPGKVISES